MYSQVNKNLAVLYIILVTIEAEEAGLQIQGQHGLQKEFRATLSNLDRACLKNVKRLGYNLVIEHFPCMCESLVLTPSPGEKKLIEALTTCKYNLSPQKLIQNFKVEACLDYSISHL